VARDYTAQGSLRTVKVLGPSSVVDVERVSATTIPHSVYFERDVPLTIWGTAGADDYVNELAVAIEQYLQGGEADNAAFIQDVDDTGLLTDAIEFTVSIPPPLDATGTFSTTVVVPVNLLVGGLGGNTAIVGALFDDALAKLHQTAGT
jgi:hypothetical protein